MSSSSFIPLNLTDTGGLVAISQHGASSSTATEGASYKTLLILIILFEKIRRKVIDLQRENQISGKKTRTGVTAWAL